MVQKRLEDFTRAETEILEEKEAEALPFMEAITKEKQKHAYPPLAPENLPPSHFVSATYDGKTGKALIKLYEPVSGKIYFWYDNTGHKPYCLTNLSPLELEKISRLMQHPGFDHFEIIDKIDPLLDKTVKVTKIVAKDPLAIGGRPKGCIRDIIPEDFPAVAETPISPEQIKVWESKIKYYQSYIYDRNLLPGMIYEVKDGRLVLKSVEEAEKMVKRIRETFKDATAEELQFIEEWARLLEYPAPKFLYVALDIEVYTPVPTRMPDPREAAYPVVCVSLYGSDKQKRVLLLKREGVREGTERLPADVTLEYFDSESKLIKAVFDALWSYPFVITFNGDDFDLRYLAHRALNHGFRRDEVPIEVGRRVCLLKYGVHIDLYKFFFNRSIQIYAFNNRYRDVTLDDVGKALIGMEKIKLEKSLGELTYTELAKYCFRDAEITFKLASFEDELVMKLILVLARISSMPMEDVSRQGVSRWIRNFMHREHRKRNMLIPNAEEIIAAKGKATTKAIIKGKKYKGAIVVEPVPGVHFNVSVMDFPSLYPSIIKVWNLGYQSILCKHPECRKNIIPDTPHWVCTKKHALESLLIGSLRDLRVQWYKPKSKDKTLPAEVRSWYNIIQGALKVILNASVDYDEQVILKGPDGRIHFVQIGEFVDKCIENNDSFSDGIRTIAKPLGWEALCFNPETAKIGFARLTHAIRHENVSRKMVQITLQSGRRVKVTPDHSIFVLNKTTGAIEPAEAAELRKGDYLIIPLSTPLFETDIRFINLPKELSKLPPALTHDIAIFIYDKLPVDQRGTQLRILNALAKGDVKSIRKIAQDTKLTPQSTAKNLNLLREKGYVEAVKEGRNLKLYHITSKGLENIPLEQVLSTKMARKKGKRGYYYIWLKDLLPVIDKIDKIDKSILLSWKIGLYGRGKSKHKIPALVPIAPELSRLIGYYVSEGHSRFFKNKRNGTSFTISITNYNEKVLEDAEKCIMCAFKIKPRYTKDRKNLIINSKIVYLLFNYIFNIGTTAETKQVPHVIINANRENKEAFFEAYCLGDGTRRRSEIKLTSKSQTLINQLSFLLMQLGVKGIYLTQDGGIHRLCIRDNAPFLKQKTKRKGYAYVVPNEYIRNIASLLKKLPYIYKDGKNIDWDRAVALLQKYEVTFGNNEYVKRFKSFLEGNLGLDKIKEIKIVKPTSNYVYDLSVEGAENFIGGYGLICLHNSYGVFGAESFDLYCPPVAEATAAIARHSLTQILKEAEELRIQVLYGDTDSIFLKNPSKEQIEKLAQWTEQTLKMSLDVDKVYRYAVFSSRKKNYLGVLEDGSVDVKGLTGKKRHIPIFIKKAFDEMKERLAIVKTPADFEKAKKDICEIIRDCYMRLKRREWESLNELAFNVVLGEEPERYTKTTPQHVRAARILKEGGMELKAGDLISFVKVVKEPHVKPVELATKNEIDVDKYIAYLHSTFDQVLDALGLDFNEIIGLTKLERFM